MLKIASMMYKAMQSSDQVDEESYDSYWAYDANRVNVFGWTNTPSQELLSSFRTPAFPGSYFLSFEGIEGAGKSTQIQSVIEYLEKRGMRVLVLREPGGTSFGERLRQAILNMNSELHPLAEAHLFASSPSLSSHVW